MTIKLQFGKEEYRIVALTGDEPDGEGELVPYGEAALLEAPDGKKYMAICESSGSDVVSLLPDEEWVTAYSPVKAETEDVNFEEGEEEEEDEEEEDDGREEPETEVEVN